MFDVAQNSFTWSGAYGMLRADERTFVDAYIRDLENEASRADQHILLVLQDRPLDGMAGRDAVFLSMPYVRAAIVERAREIASQTHLSRAAVIREWAKIAFFNAHDAVDVSMSGYVDIDLSKLTPDQWAAVQSVEVEENPRGGRKIKAKFHDKVAALKEFSRMTGLDSDAAYQEQKTKIKDLFQISNDISETEISDSYNQIMNEIT
jgi:hypothetical protein